MKNEYNFSGGERGKFYHKDITLNIPIYLNEENFDFVKYMAEKKREDMSTVVNELLIKLHSMYNNA